jgi:hypothetical protein
LKWPWGENDALQHGAGTLIHHPQPADQLPGGQGFLFGRVDLPDLVRLRGPVGALAARSARARRLQPVPAKPPLDGPVGRQRLLGEEVAQFQAQPAGTPARVLAAQGEDGGLDGRWR